MVYGLVQVPVDDPQGRSCGAAESADQRRAALPSSGPVKGLNLDRYLDEFEARNPVIESLIVNLIDSAIRHNSRRWHPNAKAAATASAAPAQYAILIPEGA